MEFASCMNAAIFVVQNDNIRRIEELSMRFGRLSFGQMRLLALVASDGSPSKVGDLARRTDQSPSIISKTSESLVKRGLLERFSAPDDRRTVLLGATEKGLAFYGDVSQRVVDELVKGSWDGIEPVGEWAEMFTPAEVERLRKNAIEVYSDLSEAIESFSLRQHRLKKMLAGVMSVNAFYLLLAVATSSEPMSVANLAKYLGIDKSSVSASVSELTRSGHIEAVRSDCDRRKIDITLTRAGEALIEQCDAIFTELFDIGQHFDEEMIRLLFRLADMRRFDC